MTLLPAYIPFVEPLHVLHDWWYLLLVPLSLGISVTYRAVRMASLKHFWRGVGIMTLQIILAMIGLAILLLLIVQVAIPLLPAGSG